MVVYVDQALAQPGYGKGDSEKHMFKRGFVQQIAHSYRHNIGPPNGTLFNKVVNTVLGDDLRPELIRKYVGLYEKENPV